MEDPAERLDKPLGLRREEERNKLKDDGWNSAAGFDANWSSLVNNAAENDSECNFSLFSFVGRKKSSASPSWPNAKVQPDVELMLTLA